MKTETVSFEPKEIDIDLGNACGLRIKGRAPDFRIKIKNNHKWINLEGVKSILIDIEVTETPLVIIERYIY